MDVQQSFDETLKNTDLQNVGIDIAEATIDSFLQEGVLKEIPIVSTITGLLKIGANVQDRLFLKKVLSFLKGIAEVPSEKRREEINKIDSSRKYRLKVGEKLLYILDTCEDYEISELVSRVFKHYLTGKISYDEFIQTASILKTMNKVDFDRFVQDDRWYHFKMDEIGDLLHTGLFKVEYNEVEVSVRDQDDYKLLRDGGSSHKYQTEVDGGVDVNLSRAGEILRELFSAKKEASAQS